MSIEDEPDKGETLQPIPDFIKYIAMGIVALIILVIIWLSTSSSDDSESNQTEALFDVQSGAVVEPKEDINIHAKTINKQNWSIVEDLPINSADARLHASKSNGLEESGLPFVKQKEESQLCQSALKSYHLSASKSFHMI